MLSRVLAHSCPPRGTDYGWEKSSEFGPWRWLLSVCVMYVRSRSFHQICHYMMCPGDFRDDHGLAGKWRHVLRSCPATGLLLSKSRRVPRAWVALGLFPLVSVRPSFEGELALRWMIRVHCFSRVSELMDSERCQLAVTLWTACSFHTHTRIKAGVRFFTLTDWSLFCVI